MELNYSKRLALLHGICMAETHADGLKPDVTLDDYKPLEAADYLASFIAFNAIRQAERSPADERQSDFDMLSVYQAYALLVYAFLTAPLAQEAIAPDYVAAQITIAKTLFAGVSDEELVEIMDNGLSKVRLIGEAEAEHWVTFRESLDKLTVSFVIAGTDDDSPHTKEEVLPLFGQLLSQLCEAFEQA